MCLPACMSDSVKLTKSPAPYFSKSSQRKIFSLEGWGGGSRVPICLHGGPSCVHVDFVNLTKYVAPYFSISRSLSVKSCTLLECVWTKGINGIPCHFQKKTKSLAPYFTYSMYIYIYIYVVCV